MFCFMYTLDGDQLREISIYITLNFHHFFMVSTLKFLSSNYFEMYNALLVIVFFTMKRNIIWNKGKLKFCVDDFRGMI